MSACDILPGIEWSGWKLGHCAGGGIGGGGGGPVGGGSSGGFGSITGGTGISGGGVVLGRYEGVVELSVYGKRSSSVGNSLPVVFVGIGYFVVGVGVNVVVVVSKMSFGNENVVSGILSPLLSSPKILVR